jgi:hypothetical protein
LRFFPLSRRRIPAQQIATIGTQLPFAAYYPQNGNGAFRAAPQPGRKEVQKDQNLDRNGALL